jgi:hypothetical protein
MEFVLFVYKKQHIKRNMNSKGCTDLKSLSMDSSSCCQILMIFSVTDTGADVSQFDVHSSNIMF